ncbi:hypothetical protein [Bradyrhizobium sp. ARR65]|uniref:hypothetical protein n=1 Tax=Bradyrhizobium sp. ARR65 TaxID=1040989 RepID=UPI0006880B9A|nr:hypothetical protein [Bradyrhizobium sp. ARR65]
MNRLSASLALLLLGLAGQSSAALARVTSCSKNGFCYCVQQSLIDAVARKLTDIRKAIDVQKRAGKAIGYLSIPLSTVGGAYLNENLKVAAEIKERIERQYGVRDVWVLNPGAKEFSLPGGAGGPDYMLMWSQVLEGEDGLGAFDFVYFTGRSDFAIHFGLDGQNDLGKLDVAYDDLAKTDPGLGLNVDKRSFRDYYGLRASVAYSLGSHDEWDIVRTINEKRRLADAVAGIARQMGVWFDGKPAAPGLLETSIATGDVGKCKSDNEEGKPK